MRYRALPLFCLALLVACTGRHGTSSGDGGDVLDAPGFDAAPHDGGPHDASARVDSGPRIDMGPVSGTCFPHTCPSGQVCSNGYCTAPPDLTFACGTNPFSTDDMCGSELADGGLLLSDGGTVPIGSAGEGVCMGSVDVDGMTVSDRHCYFFGPCPADGHCPIGDHGAVCNVGPGGRLIGNKGAICLAGYCSTVADCPTGQYCITAMAGGGGIGGCSDGSLGALCNDASQCASGTCMQITHGSRGSCI